MCDRESVHINVFILNREFQAAFKSTAGRFPCFFSLCVSVSCSVEYFGPASVVI